MDLLEVREFWVKNFCNKFIFCFGKMVNLLLENMIF